MNQEDSKFWLRSRPELLAMVVRFNTLLPSSIHPSRAPVWLNEDVARKISSTPRGQRRLSETLRRRAKLNSHGFYDFYPRHRRFALLDFSTLERLLAFTGAAMLSPSLARIIRRDELHQAKQALGTELFNFATKRVQFLLADAPSLPSSSSTLTPETVNQVGRAQLQRCLAGEPSELVKRLQLKLPVDWDLDFTVESECRESKQKVAVLMHKILISEIRPELLSCFQ